MPPADTTTAATSITTKSVDRDCDRCPRLVEYRLQNREKFPDWHNAPVNSFGNADARLLIVGLAPGLRGANWSGRPFTGDFAGDLLYSTLSKFGLSTGTYGASADDGVELIHTRITNAVRCAPPQNKVNGHETAACRPFLVDEIASLRHLRVIIALGTVAHGETLAALGMKKSAFKFAHNAHHDLGNGVILADSYHCSRYNTNTGRLTEPMFHEVFAGVAKIVSA